MEELVQAEYEENRKFIENVKFFSILFLNRLNDTWAEGVYRKCFVFRSVQERLVYRKRRRLS